MSTMTRHCHKCGTVYALEGTAGRSEACERCNADLHVCLNCTQYDRSSAHQCRDRRAEPVFDKGSANFCEWFEFATRTWAGIGAKDPREDSARAALKALLGD